MTRAIIIGGGIAGLSAAAALAPHMDVTVLEAEPQTGYHASGRSAALFIENYGNAAVRALNRASAPKHRAFGTLAARDFVILGTQDDIPAFDRNAAEMGAEEIAVSEAALAFPILNVNCVTQAARVSEVFDLDTDRLMQAYARSARSDGAEIVTSAKVERLARDRGAWTVATGDDSLHCDIVVNAAGAWADEVAALAGLPPIGLVPCRRSIARLPPPGGLDTRSWPVVEGAGESWYAKPDAGALLVSPADVDPVDPHDAWADDMVIAEGLARYQPFVTEEVTRVLTTWAGLRTFAPDRTPVIGEDPDAPGFFWLAGQGGYGFQIAPAAAQLLSDLIAERQGALATAVADALDPKRFRDQTNSGR